jgi:hypothetical protein
MIVVLKSTVPVFIISLDISFNDEHLFIRNKEQGYPYSVYKGTYSYLPVHPWFLVGVHFTRSLVLCVMFYRSLFVLSVLI